MHVLIAEDDAVSRRVLEDAVTAAGHDVTLVEDGQAAWDKLQTETFDLVISDWVMPEMDGLELCRRVRAREDAPFCHMMLVTSRNATEDIVRGIMAGANVFITKPFDRAVLTARLHAAERVIDLERSLASRVTELEDALNEIATLRQLLPICSYCKNVRDEDTQTWSDIEEHLHHHGQTDFTHSVCPTCYDDRIRPMLDDFKRERGVG